jgi:hypothetical protein
MPGCGQQNGAVTRRFALLDRRMLVRTVALAPPKAFNPLFTLMDS